jgi:hypothetical protein
MPRIFNRSVLVSVAFASSFLCAANGAFGAAPSGGDATGALPARMEHPKASGAAAGPQQPGIQLAQADSGPAMLAGNPASAPLKWAGIWLWQDEPAEKQSEPQFHDCTAQFITDRVLLTAAHCVRDQATGKYYDPDNTKTRFLLQFQNRDWSKEYHPLCKVTWDEWVVPLRPGEDLTKSETISDERKPVLLKQIDEAWQWDYAFVYVDGKTITGHYNFKVGEKSIGAVSTGYPNKIMGGVIVQRAQGDTFDTSNLSFSMRPTPNVRVLWHGNLDYTNGASGGAWVVNFNPAESPENNVIVGLNSFVMIDGSKPGAIFGPFLTDDFTTLLKFAANGCKKE